MAQAMLEPRCASATAHVGTDSDSHVAEGRMKTTKHRLLMCSAVALLLALPSHAVAVSFSLAKVADKSTPIPGGTGSFSCLLGYSLSGSNVAFWGSGFQPPFFCQPSGIYHFDGLILSEVADTHTSIPGGTGTFVEFGSPPLVSGLNVAFGASGSGAQSGIYLREGSTLKVVADTNTPIPGGAGTFSSFLGFALSENNVAFFGGGSGQGGIYLFDGAVLHTVADFNTPLPQGAAGNFAGFGAVAISGKNVVFDAVGNSFDQEGIYLFDGVTLRTVADTSMAFPGGTGNFIIFLSSLAIDGNKVAFRALGSGFQQGVYLFDGTSLVTVADTTTPIPGGTGNFFDFGFPVMTDGDTVAFLGISDSQKPGIYLFDRSGLRKVADTQTVVPGGAATFVSFFGAAMDDGDIAIGARDSSGDGGIDFFNGATLSVVADTKTPIPAGLGNFTGFASAPVIGESTVAFAAAGAGSQQGIYLATADRLSPATMWVGLKNSDDIGLRVDLRAEIFRDEALVASGELDNQSIGGSGFRNALLKTLPFSPTGDPVQFASGDTLKIRLSARRTCSGGGHNAGHVRLWYDGLPIDSGSARDAGSHLGVMVGSADNDYYLRGNAALTATPGSARRFIDVRVDSQVPCPDRPFNPFDTWSTVLP
jgi:hypothetical protein